MEKISNFIVKKYKFISITFAILTIISSILFLGLEISFNLSDYMPKDAVSMQSIDKMSKEFNEPIPNLRIVLKNTTVVETLKYKKEIEKLEDVKTVLWLDRIENTTKPLEAIKKELRETYFKDDNSLLQVAVKTDNSKNSLNKIKEILPKDTAYTGALVTEAASQDSVSSEISTIAIFSLPIALAILLFATNSWLDPIILLLTIGVAIIINMGTNIFLGKISFITQSVSSILQLSVSLDYAIFLLHEYRHQRQFYEDDDVALSKAIKISSSAVVSSALTTVFGFIVLVAMRFGIGKDLGLVLAKGVFFSLVSVVFLMPALLKITRKWLDKTAHRDFLPKFTGVAKLVLKSRMLIIIVLILAPLFYIGQARNDFTYGMNEFREGSKEKKDKEYIENIFGENRQIVLLVKRGDIGKEKKLIEELKTNSLVRNVQAYTEQVNSSIPTEIPPKEAIKSLLSDNYSRIILNTTSKAEGDQAFNFINYVRDITSKYYDNYELIGESVVLEDMSKIIKKDNSLVNLLAIASVALVILFNFKSLSIPIILVLAIQISIWINLSIPYFTNTKLSFIGYLVISSIQLGATVDYAILYTNEYMFLRQTYNKKDSVIKAGEKVYHSIIPPALILISAGVILSIVSSITLVSELGTVLGRGALLSLLMVIIVLPILLLFLDKVIEKTTLLTHFRKDE